MDAMTKMAECGINACRALKMTNTAETIVALLKQRAELLEALKEMWDAHEHNTSGRLSVMVIEAITKAEAAE